MLMGPMESWAQQTAPPISRQAANVQPPAALPSVALPGLNNEALLARDARDQTPGPLRFAEPHSTQIRPSTHGTWETLVDGRRLWRVRIASPGAESINLGFSRYRMPTGGQLFVYAPDYDPSYGPFTAADNEAHGELWTPLIPGDEVIIEAVLPANETTQLDLILGRVNHGYRSLESLKARTLSGSCNVDVACPEGDDWRAQIQSVGAYSLGGSLFCSGAVVNNSAEDQTPYFLTANHCGVTENNAASMVVYWNFKHSTCRPVGNAGGRGDGTLDQFNTGAIHRAGYSGESADIPGGPDFTLVELDDAIDPTFNVFYAGWDRADVAPPMAVTIHHPRGQEKRISFENDPTTVTSYLRSDSLSGPTHLRVGNWDVGTTEPGSSGSPLFNVDQQIVGILSGGFAACGNNEPDWYGRLAVAWTGGGTPSTRLRDWLDPLGTNPVALEGNDFQADVIPPAPITDLGVSSVQQNGITLAWTATGDDGTEGTANRYELRFARTPIRTLDDFAAATPVANPPTPQSAGTMESFTVTNLDPETPYYFALVVVDDAANESALAATTRNAVILEDRFVLQSAYPNPFRDQATLRFAVEDNQSVQAILYNALGQRVQTLYDRRPPVNSLQSIRVTAAGLVSGTYYVLLRGETFSTSSPLVLVR